MSWDNSIQTGDTTKTTAGARVALSHEERSSLAYTHETYPIIQRETRSTAVHRGLTEPCAVQLAKNLFTDSVVGITLFGSVEAVNEAVISVLSGSRTNATAARADESGQWQVTVETVSYSYAADATAWKTQAAGGSGILVSRQVSSSQTFIGHLWAGGSISVAADGSKSWLTISWADFVQIETTTVESYRSSAPQSLTGTATETAAQFGHQDFGLAQGRLGTRIALSCTTLPNARGYINTKSTTVFTVRDSTGKTYTAKNS